MVIGLTISAASMMCIGLYDVFPHERDTTKFIVILIGTGGVGIGMAFINIPVIPELIL